ncbi:phage holin [Listeria fleischmannii]|uniref:Phage holin n=1 Tax=Listeria fleischmannii TaxID=1069827 RepID=A0A841YEQ7_9LIST|nr:phage holin [Listeria fleischmannii]EIA20021.1 putative holin [Listeria fleischmannii subsp. coloradonensis]MBC1398618.1 phage holin [Listeria fleischmannii]MBC1427038.1 phage holin [Listeria fleischmannii]STY36043.1 holin, SPP1 family [Listeria fleischmannii subsp. coloradonensis]
MKKIINGLKRANVATLARSFFLLLAFVNQGLALFHMSPIQLAVDETTLANSLTTLFTIWASITAWWKNNSFTRKAVKADEVLKLEKRKVDK